jgi:Xaa-Pro aminopeptidase
LAPIDRRLIDVTLLSDTEREWLNAYHARVRNEVRSALDETDTLWLDAATAPLS